MTRLSNPEPEALSFSTVKLYVELGDDERLVVGEPSDDGTVVGVVVDVQYGGARRGTVPAGEGHEVALQATVPE